MLYYNALIGLIELEPAGVFYLCYACLPGNANLNLQYKVNSLLSVMDMRSNICAWSLLLEGWTGVNKAAGFE